MTRDRAWTAREPARLDSILEQLGEPAALAEGRVFVGSARARDPAAIVPAGASVRVRAARRAPGGEPNLLAERGDLVFVDKPAGMACEPELRGSQQTVLSWLAHLFSIQQINLHVHTRLDLPVSGVVLVSRGAAGRRECERLRAAGELTRGYLALAARPPSEAAGNWSWPVGRQGKRWVAGGRDARPASTRFQLLANAPRAACLGLRPSTGRTHQLRIHAASAGCPLLGDAERGGARRLTAADGRVLSLERVALHAAWLRVGPGGEVISAPWPEELAEVWRAAGGDAAGAAVIARAASPFLDSGDGA